MVVTTLAVAGGPSPAGAQRASPGDGPSQTAVTQTAPDQVAGVPDPRELVGTGSTLSAGGLAQLDPRDGPAPPLPPEVVSRDDQGRTTIRAIKLSEGIRLDGVLDEPVYQTVSAITGFIQLMPDEGAPATERTDAWVMFDSTNIYVSARVWDSAPPSEWVANEMRRDTSQLRDNDAFWVVFDTFHDRRNGVTFYTNPLGAIGDFAITNEGNPNSDWNPVWDVRTGRFDGGWTVEMEIPFKSLRYRPGPTQVWGIQLRRTIRRKNELAFLTPVPIAAGRRGIFRVSDAATMVGLEVPGASNNLEVKPYGIAGLTTDLAASPPTMNDGGRRRRRGRQVWHHPESDRRPHLQHRLRPSRGGRTAGQPDAVQSVLSREARVLSRRPGHLRFRTRGWPKRTRQCATPDREWRPG